MTRKRIVGTAFLLFVGVSAGNAALDFPHKMDWYTAKAQDVVLCEEQNVEFKKIAHHPPESSYDWTEIQTEVTCKVLRVFKGDLEPGAILHVDYNEGFRRVFLGGDGYFVGRPGQVIREVPTQYLPPGRALLFLTRISDKPSYYPETAKLIQEDRVYQFLQAGDPGPLELFPQQPENFKPTRAFKKDEAETEDDLIQDEVIAVRKSEFLNPIHQISTTNSVRQVGSPH